MASFSTFTEIITLSCSRDKLYLFDNILPSWRFGVRVIDVSSAICGEKGQSLPGERGLVPIPTSMTSTQREADPSSNYVCISAAVFRSSETREDRLSRRTAIYGFSTECLIPLTFD